MSHPHTLNQTLGLSWFLVLMLGLNPFLGLVVVAQSLDPLAPGKTIERELKGGDKHRFSVQLNANDFLKLSVIQKGIDVVVRLLGPDGKILQEVDSPNGTQGEEPLSFISNQAGSYTVEIDALEKTAPPGKYRLKPEAIKTATEQDHAALEIERLNDEAQKLQREGKYDQGVPLAQQAVEKSETQLGSAHPLVTYSLNNLAALYWAKGDYPQAEQLFQRILAIREKTLDSDDPNIGLSLNNLGTLYQTKGDYNRAEPLYQRALAIWEKAYGPDHPVVASTLNNLAALYKDLGDYSKTERLHQRALAIREKTLGPNHPDVASTLNNLSLLYQDQGDYAKAEPLSQRALAIYEKAYGPDHPTVALLLDSLSSIYSTKGDYSRAKSLYERALAIKEKAIGPDHPDVIHTLRNLAVVLMAQGDFGKAEPLFQRAITIQEKAFGPDNPELSLTLSNLAALYQKKGDNSQAEALYQRAIVISEKTLGPDHLDVAQSLNNLSVIYKDKGEYSQAEPVLRRALAIREKTLGPDHPLVASSLTNLAVLYQTKGDFLPAIQYRIQCNEVTERDLLRNLAAGSENQKTLYLKKTDVFTAQTLSLHLQCAPQSLEAKQAALTVLLRRKGRGLDAMASAIETLRKHQAPEVQKLLDDDANLAGQISVLTLRGPGTKKPEEHLAHLKELETQKEKMEAEISAKSAEFKSQITPITLKNVQQQIPSDGILVEFAFYKPFVPLQSEQSRLAVYTLDHKGEIKWADLGETAPIEQAVSAFRKAVARSKTDLAKDVTPAAQALDRLVIKPVRALVGKTRHLLISPDGVLNLIPFAALMDEQGKFLVEQYQLTYLTSGRDLLRLAVKIESQQPPLVIANPDYGDGAGPQILGIPLGRLLRLSGTRAEGEQIKAIFPHAELKMNVDAAEQHLKQVNRPVLVHIATHGYFLKDAAQTPVEANTRRLDRTGDDPINLEQLKAGNPLLRSWLFFAGANQAGTQDNDGVMTALEAAQLNLWGTKLVVLSACDTGLGDVKNGDGVYGLRRALVLAGSEAQMMSLWPVSDQATRELMVEYYTRLKAGEGRSEALRTVQLKFLKKPRRQHPFYWASFIQSGEWTSL